MNDDLLLLEYKESKGQWHYNMVVNKRLQMQPDTYGWASIALTHDRKANIFTYMMDCKIHQREREGAAYFTVEEVKKEWKLFGYMYNSILNQIRLELSDGKIKSHFNNAEALARLGHESFSDVKADKDLSDAWDYNPFDFKDSNDEGYETLENIINNIQKRIGNEGVPLSVLVNGIKEYAEEAGFREAHNLFNQLNNMLFNQDLWAKNVPELKAFFKSGPKEPIVNNINVHGNYIDAHDNENLTIK